MKWLALLLGTLACAADDSRDDEGTDNTDEPPTETDTESPIPSQPYPGVVYDAVTESYTAVAAQDHCLFLRVEAPARLDALMVGLEDGRFHVLGSGYELPPNLATTMLDDQLSMAWDEQNDDLFLASGEWTVRLSLPTARFENGTTTSTRIAWLAHSLILDYRWVYPSWEAVVSGEEIREMRFPVSTVAAADPVSGAIWTLGIREVARINFRTGRETASWPHRATHNVVSMSALGERTVVYSQVDGGLQELLVVPLDGGDARVVDLPDGTLQGLACRPARELVP